MVSQIILGTLQCILSSPTNVFLILIVLLVLAALRSIHIPAYLPPGPRGWPFFGSMFALAKDPVMALSDLTKQYGDIFSLKIGRDRVVVLNDFELVREALVKKQNEYAGRPWFFSLDLMSEGSEDIVAGNFTPKWKALRKIGHQAIRNYASGRKLERLVNDDAFPRFKKAIEEENGEPFEPRPILMLLVSNVIASMCFGQSYELNDPEMQRIMKGIADANESFGNGLIADFIPVFQYIPTKGLREVKKALRFWLDLIQSKVEEHKKNMEQGEVHDLVDDVLKIQREEKAAGLDHADMLTDVNVRQLVADVFGAGIDTTINTLNWAVAYLANYPDVQTKVQNEIDDVIGQDRSPLLSDKGHLPYCEATIHEVMRIRTVAPIGVPHATLQDTSVGGYNLPKGTQIWTNLWNLHMNSKHWKEPEEFRPERFLDQEGKAIPKPESYLPFSAGRRVCLGEALAKNQLFLLFVSLFQQFTFLPAPGKEKPGLNPTFEGLITRCQPYEVVARHRITEETEIQHQSGRVDEQDVHKSDVGPDHDSKPLSSEETEIQPQSDRLDKQDVTKPLSSLHGK